jgi:hypothetical protein
VPSYVVPNFAGWVVSAAQNHTTAAGVGLRVSSSTDVPFHVPDSSELTRTIIQNAPNSPPGSNKGANEWVGVQIP